MGVCSIFKNYIFYIILTSLIIISFHIGVNLGISYLYLFLIDKFLSDYSYLKYILILILFLYNYFLIRRIIIHCFFVFQFPFQTFHIYSGSQTHVEYLKETVNEFLKSLDVLLNNQHKLTEDELTAINKFLYAIQEDLSIYDSLYNIVYANNGVHNNNLIRYKMSNKQINYYNVLKNINNILNENDFKNNLKNLNFYNNENSNKIGINQV